MKKRETLESFLRRASHVLLPHLDHPETGPASIRFDSRAGDGDTPLHVAALWGDRHAVRMLLDAGADVNAKGDMGCTPLYFAVMNHHVDVAETLLAHGANPDAASELGFTPRRLAEKNTNKQMLAVFRAQN